MLTLFPIHFRNLGLFMAGLLGSALSTSGVLGSGFNPVKLVQKAFIFTDLQANVNGITIERNIAKHEIPGREGTVFQDMGGRSTPIQIAGKWIYENAPEDDISRLIESTLAFAGANIGWNWIRVEMMKALARFNAPMLLATNLFVGPVILERFHADEVGGQPNVFNYSLNLLEFNPALSIVGNVGLIATQLLGGGGSGVVRGF